LAADLKLCCCLHSALISRSKWCLYDAQLADASHAGTGLPLINQGPAERHSQTTALLQAPNWR